jgi:hypothetical protein
MTMTSERLKSGARLAAGFMALAVCLLAPKAARAQWATPTPPANSTDITNTNAGNVGVGTSSPGDRLTVAGAGLFGNVNTHVAPYGSFDSQGNSSLEIGYGTSHSNIVPFASLVLSNNTTATDNSTGLIGQFSFVNRSITGASSDKRLASIMSWVDGATNAGTLQFYTGSGGALSERMRVSSSGNVGIGTTTPGNALHVNNAFGNGYIRVSGAGLGAVNFQDNSAPIDRKIYQWRSEGGLFRMSLADDGNTGPVLQNILVATGAGKVGVGTASPADLLHVDGGLLSGQLRISGTGLAALNLIDHGGPPDAKFYQLRTDGGRFRLSLINDAVTNFVQLNILVANSMGSVGIGTDNPLYKLHVTQGSVGIQNSGSDAVVVTTSGAANESLTTGWSAGGGFGYLQGGVWGAATKNIVLQGGGGNVGIGPGMTTPTEALMVNGNISVHRGASPGPAELRVYNGGQIAEWAFRQSSATSHDLKISKSVGGVYSDYLTVSTSGNVGIGTQPTTHTLEVGGTISATGAITGATVNAVYQDVAEWVPTEQKLEAGTVVVLDTERANHVLASTTSYDTKVAGVVSARPGISLGEGGEGKALVATTGRVKVKVEATDAPIHVGDLLVTSDAEGLAMKSEPIEIGGRKMHAPGTIIGKALEPLASGTGEILVLLSLQ